MFYRPRLVHRAYAWVRGYFWIPCPICKRGFGEHEWLPDNELWLTDLDSVAVCPDCGPQAVETNRRNGLPPIARPTDSKPPSIY
jgi:hypothetical protein